MAAKKKACPAGQHDWELIDKRESYYIYKCRKCGARLKDPAKGLRPPSEK